MERTTSIEEAKLILGKNFIGPDELSIIADQMRIALPGNYPEIPFSKKELIEKHEYYILILGTSQMKDGTPLTLKSLIDQFGKNPDISEPCFYNQDWYVKEDFIVRPCEKKWFLIRKNVLNETRGVDPQLIVAKIKLPAAVLCAYVFFCNFLLNQGDLLWKHDFVWCSDVDVNNDMIYVGRYIDATGFCKNGFSIHRHLKLRNNYSCIKFY
ncbi:MAG TPA: hypothetical protein DCR40_00430 [Prolixibacteraceae bacterium]|nr:hypothetical protein [Prolixibacteraceae bacterium]